MAASGATGHLLAGAAEQAELRRSALIAIRAAATEFRLRERYSGRGPGDAGMQLVRAIEELGREARCAGAEMTTYTEFRRLYPAVRCFNRYTSEERSNVASSRRAGFRQRSSVRNAAAFGAVFDDNRLQIT